MRTFFSAICFLIMSFTTKSQQIDVQGHRGARGMLPENTIDAFIYALDQGVTTVEMDLAITYDKQIVVSHEPWMSHEICSHPDGRKVTAAEEKELNIYNLTYDEVSRFDCGNKPHPRFPDQEKMATYKPLLSDVVKAVERHVKGSTHYEVDYNIEIKSWKGGDNKYHPTPDIFSDMVYKLLDQYISMDRVITQSFDFRVLRYWNKKYPKVRLAALIENKKSVNANLGDLGFKPDIYSPDFNLLTKEKVNSLKSKGIKVIPWTVNEEKDMTRLIQWGVNGLITDYPNRAMELGITLRKKSSH